MSSIPRTVKNLDMGQLDFMWNFLKMGHQKANIPALKGLCDQLRQAMIQKSGGQESYRKAYEIDIENEICTICNSIVIETMCLYLSGALDKLVEYSSKGGDSS